MSELSQLLSEAKRDLPGALVAKRREILDTETALAAVKQKAAAWDEVAPLFNARFDQLATQSLSQLSQLKDHPTTNALEVHLASLTAQQLLGIVFLALGATIKTGVASAVQAAWPIDALTTSDRAAQINVLTLTLQGLRDEERTIIRELRSIGVEVR